MKQQIFTFSNKSYPCYFNADSIDLSALGTKNNTIIVTDQHIADLYSSYLESWKVIIVPPGEENKQQFTVDKIINKLIDFHADRETIVLGIGGGVITDMAGYAASIYMRGIRFGLMPTSILAMVDAAVGGKNGIDVGIYKNLVGVTRQPEFLSINTKFLSTLPRNEWINGFAEIIKHACIKDKSLFTRLQSGSIDEYIGNTYHTAELIEQNVMIKYNVVINDEFEKGDRKLLNFGHTIGHAIENIYNLPHGHAISIGMVLACRISERLAGFASTNLVISLLTQYHLPTELKIDKEKVWQILLHDKKKQGDNMNFIVLEEIGKGLVKSVPLDILKQLFFDNI
ncbi:MAG: 3-dehydroquinate synthase [Ginsengibacter sp.]